MVATKEQLRAQDVWHKVAADGGCPTAYVKLAKGLPALIMNSGLLQTLAFLQAKANAGNAHERLLGELREWIGEQEQWSDLKDVDYTTFMRRLMAKPSGDYQRITSEAFAWLRWVRQFAAANEREGSQR